MCGSISSWPRAEPLHTRLFGVQRTHGVGHQIVRHVTFSEDDEAVFTEPTVFDRPGDEVRQVDSAGCELLQDRDEASRFISPLKHDKSGAVMSGCSRPAGTSDENEPCLISCFVLDVSCEHLKAVQLGRYARRYSCKAVSVLHRHGFSSAGG